MEDITIKEFKERHNYLELVARIDSPHKLLKNKPVEVYCDDIIWDGHATWFWLFSEGIYIGNPVSFPCNISDEDKRRIGEFMIHELLTKSNFRDLDMELKGKAPCEQYKDVYTKCEECPDCQYGMGKGKEDACMGASYSIPTHLNSWDIQNKWDEVYGSGSKNHKEYIKERMIGHMNDFMHTCGDDAGLIKEVLDYGKEHCVNKHSELFK